MPFVGLFYMYIPFGGNNQHYYLLQGKICTSDIIAKGKEAGDQKRNL